MASEPFLQPGSSGLALAVLPASSAMTGTGQAPTQAPMMIAGGGAVGAVSGGGSGREHEARGFQYAAVPSGPATAAAPPTTTTTTTGESAHEEPRDDNGLRRGGCCMRLADCFLLFPFR